MRKIFTFILTFMLCGIIATPLFAQKKEDLKIDNSISEISEIINSEVSENKAKYSVKTYYAENDPSFALLQAKKNILTGLQKSQETQKFIDGYNKIFEVAGVQELKNFLSQVFSLLVFNGSISGYPSLMYAINSNNADDFIKEYEMIDEANKVEYLRETFQAFDLDSTKLEGNIK